MSVLEKIKQFLTNVEQSEKEQFIDHFESKLPQELRGLFNYHHFWTNGWCYTVFITIDDEDYMLHWEPHTRGKEKYEITHKDNVPYVLTSLIEHVNNKH